MALFMTNLEIFISNDLGVADIVFPQSSSTIVIITVNEMLTIVSAVLLSVLFCSFIF